MSRRVRLRYDFEFDPSELWSTKEGFSNALAKFFDKHNLEAEIVTYVGSNTDSMMLLKKKEEIKIEEPKMMKNPVKRK